MAEKITAPTGNSLAYSTKPQAQAIHAPMMQIIRSHANQVITILTCNLIFWKSGILGWPFLLNRWPGADFWAIVSGA